MLTHYVSRNVVVLINIWVWYCVLFDANLWLQAVILIVLLWDRRSLSSPLISERKRWRFSSACVKIRDDVPSVNSSKSIYLKTTVPIMKSLNHADGPIVVTLSSTLRRIVVYLLTEPWLLTLSLMFCTLISRLNQFFFSLCLFFGKKFVSCHIWMLPLHSWCVSCMRDSSRDTPAISVFWRHF